MTLAHKIYDLFFATIARRLGINLAVIARFSPCSYLGENGWFESDKRGLPVDGQGNPVPMFTYSALDFLSQRLPTDLRVFEYGSGYSTVWFARRSARLVSVEHDETWYGIIKNMLPSNAEIRHIPLDSTDLYTTAIERENDVFDLVVIDGRRRVECAKSAIKMISDMAVLIVDDWERDHYKPIADQLLKMGWRYVTFTGLRPCRYEFTSTAMFYRPASNVLML